MPGKSDKAIEEALMIGFGFAAAQFVLGLLLNGKAPHPENAAGLEAVKLDERQEGRSEVVGEIARPKLS